jgi:predicted permease
MFLVILVGWSARRRAYLSSETTGALARFVVDLTIPAMVFTQMWRTATPERLATNWFVPLLGAGIIDFGWLIGAASTPLFARDNRPTFVFLIAVSNWIYLPLPIAQALFGDEGAAAVLLFNVGAQLMLWTLGVWTLTGGKGEGSGARNLLTNSGLIATALGIAAAWTLPGWGLLEMLPAAQVGGPLVAPKVLIDALAMVGSLTIPLSLVVTGAQLGGLDLTDHRPTPALLGAVGMRLLAVPLAFAAVLWGLSRLGLHLPTIPLMVGFIIAAMPSAVNCSIFAERFGGDTSLAARSIFYGTLLSIGTVPLLYFLVRQAGL